MAVQTPQQRVERVPLGVAVRRDDWWVKPLLTVIVLGGFGIYATLRAFENRFYWSDPYLSPFYSPLLPFHLSIGGWTLSPALYILAFPLTFRMTCYYYRQAYYRAFFWDPPACAVKEPSIRKRYVGERAFPLVLQNFHRYAMYIALIFIVILWGDALRAFDFDGRFGVGLGTLLMVLNCVLLTGYTFGCHAVRHLVGGRHDCFTCPLAGGRSASPSAGSGGTRRMRTGYHLWRWVTGLNEKHMEWAWCSLFSVALTDLYIRLCAAGTIHDLRLL